MLFAVVDEFLECAGRERRMHDQHVRHLGDQRNGRETRLPVVRDVLVEVLVGDGGADGAEQESPPVGPGLGHDLRAQVAACPAPVLDDEGRAHRLVEDLRDEATEAVGGTARRERHDNAIGRFAGIGCLRPAPQGGSEGAGCNRGGDGCATMDHPGHVVPPCTRRDHVESLHLSWSSNTGAMAELDGTGRVVGLARRGSVSGRP